MPFNARWRNVALTAHITSSVGWFGAVVAFLALAVLGLRSSSDQFIRGAYIAMEAVGWYVIVPFSAASLATGLIQSAGTKWGFIRHYWVLSKLLITVGASLLLLLHMQVMSTVAEAAAAGTLQVAHLRDPRTQLVGDAAAATVVLAIAIALSVFKPAGQTPFGQPCRAAARPAWTPMAYAFWAAMILLVAAIVVRHLVGGMPHH
jgi:hypothetical protein